MRLTYFVLFLFTIVLAQSQLLVSPLDKRIEYIGRVNTENSKVVRFSWPGTAVRYSVYGESVNFKLSQFSVADSVRYGPCSYLYVIIDESEPQKIASCSIDSLYQFGGLKPGSHTVEIHKLTESHVGVIGFQGVYLNKGERILNHEFDDSDKIEFIGNSITCGYGNEGENQYCDFSGGTENNYLSYANVASRILNMSPTFIAWSGKGVLRNYDFDSVRTMPYLFNRTIPFEEQRWDFGKAKPPKIVVINLGTNDFAHQNPDKQSFQAAYLQLMYQVRNYYPDCKIVCLLSGMMSDYYPKGHKVKSTFSIYMGELIEELWKDGFEGVYLFENTTQGKLGYGCDWHPSVAQQELNGRELAEFIKQNIL